LTHSLQARSGQASDFSAATGILFGNSPDNVYVRLGNATNSVQQNAPIQGLDVQWGLWSSNAGSPAYWQTLDGNTEGLLNQLILVSAPVSGASVRNNLRGNIDFSSTGSFIAHRNSSGASVQSITGSFVLDVDNGLVNNGELHLCLGAADCTDNALTWEQWDVDFSGSLIDGKFNNASISGDIANHEASAPGGSGYALSNRYISGSLNGLLTGNSAEGFVTGFKLYETGVTTNSIIGSTIFKAAPAISTSESNALTREGFAIVAKNSTATNMGIHMGNTSDLFTAGPQGDVLVYGSSPGFVLSSAGVSGTETPNPLDYNFRWGHWTSTASEPLKYHPNLSNKGIYNDIVGEVIVVSLQPSLTGDLAGTHSFTADNKFLLTGANTSGATLSSSFTINFVTGALSNGLLTLQLSNETWTANTFTGTVTQGKLAPLSLTGTVQNNSAETSNPFTGSFAGRMTGSTNLGFLAGFDLIETGGSLARSGAALLLGSPATPVLSATDYEFLHADRFGFVLGRAFAAASPNTPLAVYGKVKVNDGDGNSSLAGVTETLVSSTASNPLSTNTSPAYIYKRHDAEVVLPVSTDVAMTGVNWGTWDASGVNNYRLFTDYANNAQYVGGSDESAVRQLCSYKPGATAHHWHTYLSRPGHVHVWRSHPLPGTRQFPAMAPEVCVRHRFQYRQCSEWHRSDVCSRVKLWHRL
jgi:hypothetical protein